MKTLITHSEKNFFTKIAENKLLDTWGGFSEHFKKYEFEKRAELQDSKGEKFIIELRHPVCL